MKIVILGGTGVFGSRLARLLARDGHELVLAARQGADRLAAELGATSLRHDRRSDPAPLFAGQPELLVDAAGPFQHYGDDPYRLVRAALAAGVNYADLSDDADFSMGISAFDGDAKARGLFALSGLSSVPALSAAVVRSLSAEMSTIHAIDSAILPGNRAPRGRSVMAAILTQTGRGMRIWSGGAWETCRGWSAPRLYDLGNGEWRRAYLNRVPDLECFPAQFGARTVSFRAGLELPIMGFGLALVSNLRRVLPVPLPLAIAMPLARLLEPFGSDRGGMVVSVTGETETGVVTRHWRLFAQAGEGPYVPAIPARALAARGGASPGARIALDDITLEETENAMADLAIEASVETRPDLPLFALVLGQDFDGLPHAVRESHAVHPVLRLEGSARVTRGNGLWPTLLARLFGFPAAGHDIPVTVTKTRHGNTETWQRTFGRARFRSVLTHTPHGMTERFGPFTFLLGLQVSENALHFPVERGWFGPLPLPRVALPKSETREFSDDLGMRFDVTLRAPLGGAFIVRYEGALRPLE